MKLGIKIKFTAFIITLLMSSILVLSIFVLNGIQSYQKQENLRYLSYQTNAFEETLRDEFLLSPNDNPEYVVKMFCSELMNKRWLINYPTKVYYKDSSLSGTFNDTQNKDTSINGRNVLFDAQKGKTVYEIFNNTVYYYAPLKYKGEIYAILQIKYMPKNNSFYEQIQKLFWIFGIIVLISGIILGILYFSPVTNSIIQIQESVKNIQNGNYDEVKIVKRKDEIGNVSQGILSMSKIIQKNIQGLEREKHNLNLALDKLKQMDKQQKQFISNISHEFKTPITSIRAYADLLEIYPDDKDLIKDARVTILKETDRLQTMLEKLIKLSVLERYDFEITMKKINIKNIIDNVCINMAAKFKKHNIYIENNSCDAIVLSDEESLNHIIINILDNAIKYNSNPGKITITNYENDKLIIIKITDTGAGIPADQTSKIFEPFYRLDYHRSSKTGGSGLGLALVKKLVETLGGKVSVQSKLNEGTTISVELQKFQE